MPSRASSSSSTPPSGREMIVGSLSLLTVAITTWAYAGRASWAPATFTSLSILTTIAAIGLGFRETKTISWKPFFPLIVFAALVGVSLLNPSHVPHPDSPRQWSEREGWLKWLPTTHDRATTLQTILPWISAFLLTGALQITVFSRRSTRLLWGTFLAHGVLVALVGIYFHVTTPYETLGLIRDRHGYHFSSFVYRNHWAAATILLVCVSLGFSFSALNRWSRDRGHFDAILGGFGIALLFALTLPIPGSRSGLIVVGAILLFAVLKLISVILGARRSKRQGRNWLQVGSVTLFASLILVGGLFLTKSSFGQHWERTKRQIHGLSSGQSDLRILFTRDTIRMAVDRPIWGWGIGSLGNVFPQYQGKYLRDPDGRRNAKVIHAHNDWAQIAAETGFVGLGLFFWFIFVRIKSGITSTSILERWITGGMVILLLYALVDFPLHNPAVLLMLSVLWSTVGRVGQNVKT
jgi:O-antigen ligase